MWYQQWWVWVLIGIAVIGIGYLKIKIFNNMMAKRKAKLEAQEEEE